MQKLYTALVVIALIAAVFFIIRRGPGNSPIDTEGYSTKPEVIPYTETFPRELMLEVPANHKVDTYSKDGKSVTEVIFRSKFQPDVINVGYKTTLENNQWTINTNTRNQIDAVKDSSTVSIKISETTTGSLINLVLSQ